MQALRRLIVPPTLPARLARLADLARNIYWSWTPSAQALFAQLDPSTWEQSNHNPVQVLRGAKQADFERVVADTDYLAAYDAAIAAFDGYIGRTDTWTSQHWPKNAGTIAYFSMEYAFHESLQIYSGGLGVLAGDHCKSASDLGLPFVAVGFLFNEGYFYQRLNRDGWQEEVYAPIDPANTPLVPVLDGAGARLKVWVELPGRSVCAQVWKLAIGRIPIYLLDAKIEENNDYDRTLTARLYGQGQELRVAQELLLGVGGLRALDAMGIEAACYHMNEGHAAFLGLERARKLIQNQGLTLAEAVEAVAAGGIFTTHTPVPAGNDAFDLGLIDRMLGGYWYEALGAGREAFLELGRHDQAWGPSFSMTVLALRLSRFHNGVSELHGHVSRGMWNFLWPEAEREEVPIGHVTNGIHTRTFLAPELATLFDAHLGQHWDDQIELPATWAGIDQISDEALEQARNSLKRKLVGFARNRSSRQRERVGLGGGGSTGNGVLREDVLTIGFARRFATYKRATLLFRDLERLKRIVNNPERPVQFVFAGKAHPADNPGKEFIQAIFRMAQDPAFAGRIVILEDYDMNVARHMVQGADIWLNNPRRPLEASGTSGEKASLNGCINFSALDGWWREAWDGSNGWAIGDERDYTDLAAQDAVDAQSLYDTLEFQIAPLYYDDRHGWLQVVRNAIKTVAPHFSMQRQVQDYALLYYSNAARHGAATLANDFAAARQTAAWKAEARANWSNVRLEAKVEGPAQPQPGSIVTLAAKLWAGNLPATMLRVEAVLKDQNGELRTSNLVAAGGGDGALLFRGNMLLPTSGEFELGVRALPYREGLANELEAALLRWAGNNDSLLIDANAETVVAAVKQPKKLAQSGLAAIAVME
jgi:glycogen phosphorylase